SIEGLHVAAPRFVQLAAVAFQEAWCQSGAKTSTPFAQNKNHPACDLVPPERLGVLLGTSRGVVRELEIACDLLRRKGPAAFQAKEPELLAALFPTFGASILGRSIAALAGAQGPVGTLSAACASGTIVIGEGAQWIREGRCDRVIAGGAEAPFTPTSFAGVCSSKAMSERWDEPSAACRPFDRTRDGYVMGEGAGVFIMEAEEIARARGAHIFGEVLGYAQTDDASHITVPTGEGLRTAITFALQAARLAPHDLDYINAHGTSTQLNDRWETWAVKQALGDAAYRIPISSTKSMTGHLLGAAGAVEAIASLVALQEQFQPPTLNYREPDPLCDLDYVPNESRPAQLHTVMSQSLGFGGHNAALVLGRV
ncbi:MAG: beta-ketoacyl-[acyl-carrier-protein] synthase family protein, partial [Tumebacillaceae bacterium]